MQTFSFNELDERGQDYAENHYYKEPAVVAIWSAGSCTFGQAILSLGWRFTEHGERIA